MHSMATLKLRQGSDAYTDFAQEWRNAIKLGLAKLLTAGFMKEVFHSKWLSNPVLVKTNNINEWRIMMCTTLLL